jgi:protein phosphatase
MPPKPRDEDLDFFGLTHQGKVRKDNQDHFLISTLHKTIRVHSTSLPNPELLELPSQRLASFSMVADGVGGHAGGEEASRAALEAIAEYVINTMYCFYAVDAENEAVFLQSLQDAAAHCHDSVVARARESGIKQGMATTLTAAIGLWPYLYVLQVGDSRCYRLRHGELEQLTRDQTLAQDLVDSGVMPPARAQWSPLAHVLSSSIGGTAQPIVTRNEITGNRTDVYLLCTDGLTKHVPDERIRDRLRSLVSSEQVCRALVDDALDGGGSDNVTVVVLRALPRPGETASG